jgi:glycosyltransferase involved in cell wall biosynthesis
VLRAGEYDVIHSHYIDHSGSIMQMGARAGVPVRVVHCHNDLAPVWADASLVRRSYFRLMNRLIRRCATAGLAASAGAASTMFGSEWPSDGRWMLLPYGIDLRPFRNGVGRAATRMSLGIPANAFVVAHVGRFVPQKNHAFLLEVISATVAVTRDACFLLVGEGPDEAAFERAASTRGLSGCIVRVSGRPDVPDLLAAADAFAFPSRFEGLGIAAVEAQAAGLPCVLSDRVPSEACVVPELVDRLPLSSPEAWAAALVASRSRPALPAALALETVSRSLMNIDRSIAVLESVYDSGRRSKAAVA